MRRRYTRCALIVWPVKLTRGARFRKQSNFTIVPPLSTLAIYFMEAISSHKFYMPRLRITYCISKIKIYWIGDVYRASDTGHASTMEAKPSRYRVASESVSFHAVAIPALNLCVAIAVNEIQLFVKYRVAEECCPCAFRSRHLIRFLALHFLHFNALGVSRIQLRAKLQYPPLLRAAEQRDGGMNAKRFSEKATKEMPVPPY